MKIHNYMDIFFYFFINLFNSRSIHNKITISTTITFNFYSSFKRTVMNVHDRESRAPPSSGWEHNNLFCQLQSGWSDSVTNLETFSSQTHISIIRGVNFSPLQKDHSIFGYCCTVPSKYNRFLIACLLII